MTEEIRMPRERRAECAECYELVEIRTLDTDNLCKKCVNGPANVIYRLEECGVYKTGESSIVPFPLIADIIFCIKKLEESLKHAEIENMGEDA